MFKLPGYALSIAVRDTNGASSPTPILMAMLKSAERQGARGVLSDEDGAARARLASANTRSWMAMFGVLGLVVLGR